MSLYHEAAQVIDKARAEGGSLKSIVFGQNGWKSNVKILFALSIEAAKWSEILSEVIENSDILQLERQFTTSLSLVLTHDLLLSKRGLALPRTHGLHVSITRHKARLSAELSKARLRRRCTTLMDLKAFVNIRSVEGVAESTSNHYPRWVRINTLRTSLEQQLHSTFSQYRRVPSLAEVMENPANKNLVYIDEHIPNLIAICSLIDITAQKAYKSGEIILQDKASCFPAYFLFPLLKDGAVIDACAAPGNKTTHLAAILQEQSPYPIEKRVIACEKDTARSQTLNRLVNIAGARGAVMVRAEQDFLNLDPRGCDFRNVTALLLDPSCSGSGIMGRDEANVDVQLPMRNGDGSGKLHAPTGKKRKRGDKSNGEKSVSLALQESGSAEKTCNEEKTREKNLPTRLAALSAFQLRIVEHAMSFPAAKKIIYSTCSLYEEENEHVVAGALKCDVAKNRGWRLLERPEQVEGMQKWNIRGRKQAVSEKFLGGTETLGTRNSNAAVIAESCIRCEKGGMDGTIGFFVAGFVRDTCGTQGEDVSAETEEHSRHQGSEDEWNGFDDDSL